MEEVICNKCGRKLPQSSFYKNTSAKSGIRTTCIECDKKVVHARKKKYREINEKRIEEICAKKYRCNICGKIKNGDEFHLELGRKEGIMTRCKDCLYMKTITNKYKITPLLYKRLLKEQKNKCAICGLGIEKYNRRFDVDHDHKSDNVRGLLCNACNTLVSKNRNAFILIKAIKYLKKPQRKLIKTTSLILRL